MSVMTSASSTWGTEILGNVEHDQKSSDIKLSVGDIVAAPKESIDDPDKHHQRHPNRSNIDRGEANRESSQGLAAIHENATENVSGNQADRNISMTASSTMNWEVMPAAYEWPHNERGTLHEPDFDAFSKYVGAQFDEHDLSVYSSVLELKDHSEADMVEGRDQYH